MLLIIMVKSTQAIFQIKIISEIKNQLLLEASDIVSITSNAPESRKIKNSKENIAQLSDLEISNESAEEAEKIEDELESAIQEAMQKMQREQWK